MIATLELDDSKKSMKINIEVKSGLTIFVGPNNSGKSSILRDIYRSVSVYDSRPKQKKSALIRADLKEFDPALVEIHPLTRGLNDEDIITNNHGRQTKEEFVKILQDRWHSQVSAEFRASLCAIMNGAQRLSMLPTERSANLKNQKARLPSSL